MLLKILKEIPDNRGKKGRQYENWAVLFIAILAMISGANSYRQIHTFTKQRLGYFKEKLSISWRQAPSYSSIRVIIRNTDEERLEKTFRKHANLLDKYTKYDGKLHISSDGKAIKGSYDNKKEEDAIHFLNLFVHQSKIILGHEIVWDKTNEIPVFQEMLKVLEIEDAVYTADAMHIQKKQ